LQSFLVSALIKLILKSLKDKAIPTLNTTPWQESVVGNWGIAPRILNLDRLCVLFSRFVSGKQALLSTEWKLGWDPKPACHFIKEKVPYPYWQ
jgi:hypothetical protein